METPTIDARRQSILPETWREFNRAIRSPQPFNPFFWIYRLSLGILDHVLVSAQCGNLRSWDSFLYKVWRPLIPLFGFSLVGAVDAAYFMSLRTVILERWCCAEQATSALLRCKWMLLHDFLVVYLSCSFLFHYIATMMRSPGVALRDQVVAPWRAAEGQGGTFGFNPVIDEAAERKRVASYGPLHTNKDVNEADEAIVYFPAPEASFCDKCQIRRPPRCHHCSVCDRCILQYDHHCIWVNNCIGFNNYRHFFLMLFFLAIACWYGVAMLFFAFFDPLRQRLNKEGWRWFYSNKTGLLNLPPPLRLMQQVYTRTIEVQTIVDLVFPLLFGVGCLITGLLASHGYYVVRSRTTLEHKILIDDTLASIRQEQGRPANNSVVNPYDNGWSRNLRQALGHNLLLILLPMMIEPEPPLVPNLAKNR